MKDVLQVEKRYFSYLMAVAGLGMGVSAALVGKFGSRFGKEKLISRGFISMGAILIALANVQVLSHWFQVASKAGVASALEIGIAFVLAFFLGLSAAAIAVPIQTLLQEKTPEHLRGKVFGVQNMLVNTAMTLPMSLAGVLADALDNVSPGNGVIWVMSLVGLILILGAFLKQPKIQKAKA